MAPQKTRKAPAPDNPEGYRRFVETAREVEADKSPGALDRASERVVEPNVHPITTAERRAINAEIRRSRQPRTAEQIHAELVQAESEYEKARHTEEEYDGNNPGKLTRLQKATRNAQARAQSLKAELESLPRD